MKVPVSIVIPVFNGRQLLKVLLESIAQQTAMPSEIIVVDNGSTDGAADVALRAGARVISMGRNAGFAAAVNRGIAEASGEAVALINSDVELHRRWLEVIWEGTQSTGAHFATGQILQADSDVMLDGTYDLICRGGCSWRAGEGRPVAKFSPTSNTIHICSATAALFRTDLFKEIGIFAELFESYLEDVDFGLRCTARGRTGAYLPGAVCWHRGSATFGRWSPAVVGLIARNQVFLIARHYPWKLIGRWMWPILTAHVLWGALAIRHGCGMAWVGGKVEALWRFAAVRRGCRRSCNLAPVIADSEQQIFQLQSETGFDAYWKLYFRLAGAAK